MVTSAGREIPTAMTSMKQIMKDMLLTLALLFVITSYYGATIRLVQDQDDPAAAPLLAAAACMHYTLLGPSRGRWSGAGVVLALAAMLTVVNAVPSGTAEANAAASAAHRLVESRPSSALPPMHSPPESQLSPPPWPPLLPESQPNQLSQMPSPSTPSPPLPRVPLQAPLRAEKEGVVPPQPVAPPQLWLWPESPLPAKREGVTPQMPPQSPLPAKEEGVASPLPPESELTGRNGTSSSDGDNSGLYASACRPEDAIIFSWLVSPCTIAILLGAVAQKLPAPAAAVVLTLPVVSAKQATHSDVQHAQGMPPASHLLLLLAAVTVTAMAMLGRSRATDSNRTRGFTVQVGRPELNVTAHDAATGLPTVVNGHRLKLSKHSATGYANVKIQKSSLVTFTAVSSRARGRDGKSLGTFDSAVRAALELATDRGDLAMEHMDDIAQHVGVGMQPLGAIEDTDWAGELGALGSDRSTPQTGTETETQTSADGANVRMSPNGWELHLSQANATGYLGVVESHAGRASSNAVPMFRVKYKTKVLPREGTSGADHFSAVEAAEAYAKAYAADTAESQGRNIKFGPGHIKHDPWSGRRGAAALPAVAALPSEVDVLPTRDDMPENEAPLHVSAEPLLADDPSFQSLFQLSAAVLDTAGAAN